MTLSAQSENQRGVNPSSRSSFFTIKRLSGEITPKLAVIRPELAALTGNPLIALALNQLLYWTERLPDFDQLVREELAPKSDGDPCYGWFYKSSEELAEETLLYVDRTTIRRYLSFLIEQGWVSERSNPGNKWNKTTHYRVNIRQLCYALRAIGYDLPGFPLEKFQELQASLPVADNMFHSSGQNARSIEHIAQSNGQFAHTPQKHQQISNGQNAQSSGEIAHSNGQNVTFERANSPFIYLTEITTETTSREHAECAREDQEFFEEEKKVESSSSTIPTTSSTSTQESDQTHAMAPGVLAPASASLPPPVPAQAQAPAIPSEIPATEASSQAEVMVKVWEESVGLSPIHLNENRKSQLKSILERHFHEDMSHWKAFCHRVKSSPFLMGEGGRRWRVTLDWILEEKNLIKILEGNFDDGPGIGRNPPQQLQTQSHAQGPYEIESQALLSTIKDPTWKAWCTDLVTRQLAFNDRIPIFTLKHIVRVKFLEREGHLAWLECEDQGVLSRIENLRLSLLSVVQRTYPEIRNIRTKTPNRIYP